MSKKAKWYLLILAGLIVLGAFVGFNIYREWYKFAELDKEKAQLQAVLETEKNKTINLQQSIEDSTKDTFVERMARELLGWVKPGEIKIVDKDK